MLDMGSGYEQKKYYSYSKDGLASLYKKLKSLTRVEVSYSSSRVTMLLEVLDKMQNGIEDCICMIDSEVANIEELSEKN